MTAKTSRSELANALAEVRANMVITRKQRQKQGLERMLGMLQQLREAAHLHDALRLLPSADLSFREHARERAAVHSTGTDAARRLLTYPWFHSYTSKYPCLV